MNARKEAQCANGDAEPDAHRRCPTVKFRTAPNTVCRLAKPTRPILERWLCRRRGDRTGSATRSGTELAYGRRREVGRVRQLMRGAIAQMALPHLARRADASRVEAKRRTWMTSARIACLHRSAALPSLLNSSHSY